MCGECCGAWNLPIDDKLKNELLKHNWVIEILKNSSDFNIINNQSYLPKKEGICVFVDKKNKLCKIHKELGPEYKPLECNRFPFAMAKDKQGNLYIDTSFYCKSIVQNKGECLASLLTTEFLSSFDLFEFPDKVKFSHKVLSDYSVVREIRETLSTYLYEQCKDISAYNWHKSFFKGLLILLTIEKQLKQKKKFSITEIIEQIDQKNIRSKKILFKLKLINSILLRKKAILPEILIIFAEKATIKEPIIAERINLRHLSDIKAPIDNVSNEQLLRFFLDIFNRKILLAHGHNVISIYVAMLAIYSLTLWYAKALASLDKKDCIEQFHSELAIRIAERYYVGHNVKFMELFRNNLSSQIFKAIFLL